MSLIIPQHSPSRESGYGEAKKGVALKNSGAAAGSAVDSTKDVVTLSAQRSDAGALPPSQSVSLEEKQALNSTFSVLA